MKMRTRAVGVHVPLEINDNVSGIYRIVNISDGSSYVGSAVSMRSRIRRHALMLIQGKHHAAPLQKAWDSLGQLFFRAEILELVEKQELIQREQHWFNELRPVYNVCKVAGNTLGHRKTDEQRKKICDALAAARSRGVVLGGKRPMPKDAWVNSVRVRVIKARDRYQKILPTIISSIKAGLTYDEISCELSSDITSVSPRQARQAVDWGKSQPEYTELASIEVVSNAQRGYNDILPMILDLRNSGHGLKTIARILNDMGRRTARGHIYRDENVRRVVLHASKTIDLPKISASQAMSAERSIRNGRMDGEVAPIITMMRTSGVSDAGIARHLNTSGYKDWDGREFNGKAVRGVMRRVGKKREETLIGNIDDLARTLKNDYQSIGSQK
jgi:hypothetical protein